MNSLLFAKENKNSLYFKFKLLFLVITTEQIKHQLNEKDKMIVQLERKSEVS